MIVQCAACQARFKIADDKVTDRGVKVRCRKCSTVFVVRRESAPAPDAPPLGRTDTGGPPRPGTSSPGGGDDPFRRFKTSEITGDDADDPFAAITRPSAPIPKARPAVQDPFAAFQKPAVPPPMPELTPAPSDPFAGKGPPRQVPASAQPTSADPFANVDVGDFARPALAPAAAPQSGVDPFANIDIGEFSRPEAKSAPAPAASADPFANLNLGEPPAAPAPTARSGADPFAGVELGAPPSQARPAAVATPGKPALPDVPGALDLGSIELGPKEFEEDPAGMELETPAAPVPVPMSDEPPRTVVTKIAWGGGAEDKVTTQSAAAVYAAQLLAKRAASRPRRNLALSLLAALAFLGIGGLVLERTARAIRGARTTAASATLACEGLGSGFYASREGRAFFVVHGKIKNNGSDKQGPAVKVTVELRRGSTVERTADAFVGSAPNAEELWAAAGPLEISEVVQRANSRAGPLAAGASADFRAVFSEYPDDIADLVVRATPTPVAPPPPPAPRQAESATKVEPAARPPDAAAAAKPGAEKPAASEPAAAQAETVAAKPEPAAAEKKVEFPMDEPKRPLKLNSGQPAAAPAKAAPAKVAPAKAAPKKFEFPMDDPKRPPKVNSGTPPAAKTP